MKKFNRVLALLLATLFAWVACGKKGVETSALTAAFQPTAGASTNESTQAAVKSSLEQAVAALRSEDYPRAALQLQTLRAQPMLTPQQLTVIQDTMADVQQRLAAKAELGDPAALKAAEELRKAHQAQRRR